ncbi:MAG: ABC transporter ATP-binding protein [Rhizobiales bacterium]|nr:ABC transporter ATP-binding protein [Hyphomicrobiales bacterium]
MAGVAVTNVRKSFGAEPVLADVSLDIRDGEFLSVLGPSGCGKSTLLKLIAGLDIADSGEIRVGDRVVSGVDARRHDVAMVFQSYALYPHLSAGRNIAVPLEMQRLNGFRRLPLLGRLLPGTGRIRAGIRADVEATAAQVRLSHLLDRLPRQLSGGERQRVAIARALVRRLSVLLMDEPLSNLDAQLRVAMRGELAELHRRTGLTIIFVTHDQAEAMSISSRVAVMMKGRLQQVAEPRVLYDRPDNLAVAAFVGDTPINLLPARVLAGGTVEAAGVRLAFDGVPETAAGLQMGIRPEWLRPADAAAADTWTGVVTGVEYFGAEAVVRLELKGGHSMTVRWDGDWALPATGKAQPVRIKPGRGLLFAASGDRIGEVRPADAGLAVAI